MKLTRIAAMVLTALFAGIFVSAPATAQKASTTAKKTNTTKASAKKATPKKKAAAPKSAAKKAKKTAKKPSSPCVGLKQRACTANKVCGWIKPKKKVSTDGRKLTAYCRKVAGIGKKKSTAKKTATKKPAAKKTATKKSAPKKTAAKNAKKTN